MFILIAVMAISVTIFACVESCNNAGQEGVADLLVRVERLEARVASVDSVSFEWRVAGVAEGETTYVRPYMVRYFSGGQEP